MVKVRIDAKIEPEQLEKLRKIKEKTGAPIAETLRRAIDEYWEKFEKKGRKVI